MAVRRVVIGWGSSQWQGHSSKLSEYPAADYERVYGIPFSTQFAVQPTGFPFTQTVPGVKMWTPKIPYSDNIARTITAAGAATLTYSGVASGAGADSWVFISLNTTGQGNLAKVLTDDGSLLTVTANWTLPLAGNGEVRFLQDSHSTHADSTVTTIKRTATTRAFTAADIGRNVLFFSGAVGNVARKVADVVGDHSIVLDDALTVLPATGTGFIVLSGAGAYTGLDDYSAGAAFRDLTLHLNTPPCSLDGFDYPNHNLQAVAGPTFSVDVPINLMPELMWRFRSMYGDTIYGVSLGIDSATISPQQRGTFLRPLYWGWQKDITHLDFHPSTPNSLLTALTTAIASMKALIEAEGDTMDVVAVCHLIYENESLDLTGAKVEQIAANARLVRSYLRGLPGLTDRTRYVMWGPSSELYVGRDRTYHLLQQLADEDPYTGLVDTRDPDLFVMAADGRHWNTQSHINAAKVGFKTWAALPDPELVEAKELEVCNIALAHIGIKARLESLEDGSPEADACALYLPRAVKAVLGMHAWSFALEKRALVVVNEDEADTDNPAYLFRYEIPLDCVTALKIVPEDAPHDDLVGGVRVPVDFKRLRSPVDGVERIYTNQVNAHLRYVTHERDLTRWDELAILALTWHVASLLAGALIKSEAGTAHADNCLRRMGQYLAEAKQKDSNERQVTLDRPAAQIQARR